jgi:hypothetical protein
LARDHPGSRFKKDISTYSVAMSEIADTAGTRRYISATKGKRAAATSRIPVSRAVWASLSSLKMPGETYDQLLDRMIEFQSIKYKTKYQDDRSS